MFSILYNLCQQYDMVASLQHIFGVAIPSVKVNTIECGRWLMSSNLMFKGITHFNKSSPGHSHIYIWSGVKLNNY